MGRQRPEKRNQDPSRPRTDRKRDPLREVTEPDTVQRRRWRNRALRNEGRRLARRRTETHKGKSKEKYRPAGAGDLRTD